MKRKTTYMMDCEKARNIDLVSTLAKSGHFPVRETEKEAWFLSPFRTETQASFKVSLKKNYWIDFGTFEGGQYYRFGHENGELFCKGGIGKIVGSYGSFFFSPAAESNQEGTQGQSN